MIPSGKKWSVFLQWNTTEYINQFRSGHDHSSQMKQNKFNNI